ncbi:uncharacterized protein LOC107265572 [Cephus cinctus]|uniref:Uncharacterized protein LOC107265572 n=1 Tax=Cephus cinctus TaxID=211228 RepID=A0AAJ7FGH0_CEPCN|nr:uncharacterized protein LOC107265572 [Cephus cinctus]
MSDTNIYLGKEGTKNSYPTRCRSSVLSRRLLNGYEAEGNTEAVSASAKKLKVCSDDFDVNYGFGYRIINFIAVFSTIAQHVKCKKCDSNISFQERSPRGLGFKIVIACPNCPDVEIPSSKLIQNAYEINRRIVLAMRLLGIGLTGITKFCAFMELPRPIFQSFYDNIVNMISIAAKSVRDANIKKEAQEEKEESEEIGQSEEIIVSGGNFEVQKNECIHDVQKIMSTRLRNLKKTVKGLGGKGKLTAKLINQLTVYYGLAIRRNANSLENMKKEIWATLFHKLSTDENPQHQKCSDTWCDWKKAESADTLDTYYHRPALSKVVFDAIKPIYEDLSRDEFLNRCLGGYTQNSNKSFNATVSKLAPESYSSGETVLDLATDLAVCNFNNGLTSILQIMKILEMDIGIQSYNFCLEADAMRTPSIF